jgi:signal transduction histidine kinase
MPQALSTVDSVAKIFHEIPDLAAPAQVQASLRDILGDPTLELSWWDWEQRCYVDVHGTVTTFTASEARVVTPVEYESRKIGAIAHDPVLLESPEFLHSFVPAMRIAMERDRLHRDLTSKLEQLNASRLRIVEAADAERRRLERNLHDGAQQRLMAALLQLRALERSPDVQAEVKEAVARSREELEGAIADLRELARGLHPPLLTSHGLEAAVRAAVERTTMPVDLDVQLEQTLAPAVAAAAYYVCGEALANVAKHAQATTVRLEISCADGLLQVVVEDDGVGGATVDAGGESTGLRGLCDRVEALAGTIALDSPTGSGTRLLASFPLDS